MEAITFYAMRNDGATIERIATVPQEDAEQLIEHMRDSQGGAVHKNSDAIRVVSVDMVKFSGYLPPSGKARTVEPGERFPSHLSFARRIGLTSAATVNTYLSAARKEAVESMKERLGVTADEIKEKRIKLRPKATLRGVTFQSEEDYDEDADNDVRT